MNSVWRCRERHRIALGLGGALLLGVLGCNDGRSSDVERDAGSPSSDVRNDASASDAAPEDDASRACVTRAESEIPGVTLSIDGSRCVFSPDELEAGVAFGYELLVEQPLSLAVVAQDAGQCGQPDESGLIPFAEVFGGGQRYCLCDLGRCAGDTPSSDLAPGTYAYALEWTGRNWEGPSDTGTSFGDPFPPGAYTVRASVQVLDGDGVDRLFTASAELDIEVLAE